MAIVANTGFFVRMDYALKATKAVKEGDPDVVAPEVTLRAYGTGVIEGENSFGIEKALPYDGAMKLADLVAAAQAAINGKTADVAMAVAKAKA